MSVSAKHNGSHSPLLRLPAEIRNRVFQYALAGELIRPKLTDEILVARDTYCPAYMGKELHPSIYAPPSHRFSLLCVCRQVYAETAMLPYTLSTFTFISLHTIIYWLDSLLPQKRKLIQHVHSVQFGNWCGIESLADRAALKSLKEIDGLERLDVRLYEIEWTTTNPTPQQIKETILEYFAGTRVKVSVTSTPRYSDWIKEWARSSEVDRQCKIWGGDAYVTWEAFLDENAEG